MLGDTYLLDSWCVIASCISVLGWILWRNVL